MFSDLPHLKIATAHNFGISRFRRSKISTLQLFNFEAWKESVRKGNIELQYSIFTIKNDVFERDSPRVLSPDQGQLRGKLSSFAGPVRLESDEEVGRDHQEEPTAGPSHRAQEADTVSAQPIRKRPWRITPIQFP